MPQSADRLLLTPGPLTTSMTVKQAMLRDLGSRDEEFIGIVRAIRRDLVRLAGGAEECCTAVPMPGSGTYGLEAVAASVIAPDGALLVASNGAYGRRMAHIARVLGIRTEELTWPEDEAVSAETVAAALDADPALTHVAVVHCETTSGLVNPITELGRVVAEKGRTFIVDAMSSFGAVPIDMERDAIGYLISSANKCVEGVPGFCFVIARLERLLSTEGYARSVSLDLLEQHRVLEATGQFRFTPPTHALLAFRQALHELEAEGGPEARGARYAANHAALVAGMRRLGFREYLRPELQSPVITTFHCPKDPAFTFEEFHALLREAGYVIYPGKVGDADCFRIGTIGRVSPADILCFLDAVRRALQTMAVAP